MKYTDFAYIWKLRQTKRKLENKELTIDHNKNYVDQNYYDCLFMLSLQRLSVSHNNFLLLRQLKKHFYTTWWAGQENQPTWKNKYWYNYSGWLCLHLLNWQQYFGLHFIKWQQDFKIWMNQNSSSIDQPTYVYMRRRWKHQSYACNCIDSTLL